MANKGHLCCVSQVGVKLAAVIVSSAVLLTLSIFFEADASLAEERSFTLSIPRQLVESGLPKYLLPRFSLKHGVRVEVVDAQAPADMRLSNAGQGVGVFSGNGETWHLTIENEDSAPALKFAEWLRGDKGRETIAAFAVGGENPFTPIAARQVAKAKVVVNGDARLGETLSEKLCGRCHMVNERTRMTTIGSTPSFALMRSFADWNARFSGFYALRPHAAFTQIEDVTPAFDPALPSPIAPIEMTLSDIEAIVAYVASIEPADLGAPLKHQ